MTYTLDILKVIGKVGKVVKIDSDGDVAIGFGDKAWVFNPVCCLLAPGEKLLELEAIREDEGDSSSGKEKVTCLTSRFSTKENL